MKIRSHTASLAISSAALFLTLGGTGYAASQFVQTANNAQHLGGKAPSYYLPTRQYATSHGVHFLSAGQNVTLGHVGHFTFTASCTKDSTGQNQVAFGVTADTTADLDGNGPMPAGTPITIHTDSDAMDSTTANPLSPGAFAQVGSASSSTEIANGGQEVDIFYNDGVNWPAGHGAPAHDCFAGYTGILG